MAEMGTWIALSMLRGVSPASEVRSGRTALAHIVWFHGNEEGGDLDGEKEWGLIGGFGVPQRVAGDRLELRWPSQRGRSSELHGEEEGQADLFGLLRFVELDGLRLRHRRESRWSSRWRRWRRVVGRH